MDQICEECYSSLSRITPLLKPRNCLENHVQYICGTCGRCICIDKDEKRGVQRWNFPFKTLEIAKLYLRTADISVNDNCGIYEITSKTGRVSYKILHTNNDLKEYLNKNKDKTCYQNAPVYKVKEFKIFSNSQIRKLMKEEVEIYLQKQK